MAKKKKGKQAVVKNGAKAAKKELGRLVEKIAGLEKKLSSAGLHMPSNTPPFFLDMLASASSEGMHEAPDEETALKLAGLYFKEIARLGFKRSLDLDAIINAYFYTLQRVKDKDKLLMEMGKKVIEEETRLKTQSREEMIPSMQEQTHTSITEETRTEEPSH